MNILYVKDSMNIYHFILMSLPFTCMSLIFLYMLLKHASDKILFSKVGGFRLKEI